MSTHAHVCCFCTAFVWRYPIALVLGLFIVRNARWMSRSAKAYYGTTVPLLSFLFVFIAVFYIISYTMQSKRAGAATMAATFVASLGTGAWSYVRFLFEVYPQYAMGGLGVICVMSFIVVYYFGPPDNSRSQNIYQGTLTIIGLLLVFAGTNSLEVSTVLLVLAPLTVLSAPLFFRITVAVISWIFSWIFYLCGCSRNRPADAATFVPTITARLTEEQFEQQSRVATLHGKRRLRHQIRASAMDDIAPRLRKTTRGPVMNFVYGSDDDAPMVSRQDRMNTPIKIGPNGERYDPDELDSDADLNSDFSD